MDFERSPFQSGKPIAAPRVARRLAQIQRIVEAESLEIRRTLRMYTQCLELHRQLMQTQRQAILEGTQVNSLLKLADGDLYLSLTNRYGKSLVHDAETSIAIFHIDDCWADHLQVCAEVRNSIHLVSMGGSSRLILGKCKEGEW